MEAVHGKVAHVSLIGFMVGSSFTLFRGVDTYMRSRLGGRGVPRLPWVIPSPSVAGSADAPASGAAYMRQVFARSGVDGWKIAAAVGLAHLLGGYVSLAQHGRNSEQFMKLKGDFLTSATHIGVGTYMLYGSAAPPRERAAVSLFAAIGGGMAMRHAR